MSDDPYAALGLTKSASADDIKKAYRKLVRTSHPDLNPDDAGAEARFKAASAAHDLLKDPATRTRYDAGEIDGSGAERPQRRYYRDFAEAPDNAYSQGAGFGAYDDPSDIFAEILRQRGPGRSRAKGASPFGDDFGLCGQDLHFNLEVPFLDAIRGTKARISLLQIGEVEVQIPKGSTHGQTLRLRGKGGAGIGTGPAGDAMITLSVRPDAVFRRDGDTILVTLPITLDEAILGAKVRVPTIDGQVNLTIPKGSSSGRTLRLRGRGAHRPNVEAGDQLVELQVILPSVIDDGLRDFIEAWREKNPYDPRKTIFEEGSK